MKPQVIRHLLIALLMLTGVFHLLVAMLNGAPGLGWPLTAFGVIYFGLSFYVRKDVQKKAKNNGRIAITVTVAVAALGLALGGLHYVQNDGPGALLMMGLMEIAIFAAGAMWLLKTRAKG